MRLSRTSMFMLTASLYIALRAGIPFIPVKGLERHTVIIFSLALVPIFMLVQLAVVPGIIRLQPRKLAAVGMLIIGTALFVGTIMAAKAHIKLPPVPAIIVRDFSLMLAAISFGYLVSFIFKEPKIILPVGIVAALVDFWNVYVGPLGDIVEKKPEIVNTVSVHVPTPAPHLNLMAVGSIGMGDIVFLAMFFAVIYRFSMNANKAFWLGYALLTISMVLTIVVDIPIPALVPMGIAMLVTNTKFFKLNREEILSTILVSGLVAVILGAHAFMKLRLK